MNSALFNAVAAHLHTDANRWPDRHGDYHADCPYCGKSAKKAQTHFVISKDGLCYCQVCQQGTTLNALAKHLGLTMTSPNRDRPQPQTTYDYYDAHGVLAYQAVRYLKQGKKAFYQRRPDDKGGWIYKLDGVDRVLYRLPEVLAAMVQGEPIFIVEGEKDVETLRLRGLVATTNVGGAGKWYDTYSQMLKGATVYILPDNDKPGEEHAQIVRQALRGVAQSARIVRLPDLADKEDVTDWFSKGHTVEELRSLIASSAQQIAQIDYIADWRMTVISAAELRKKLFAALVWLVDGIIPEGAVILAGKPKTKKSWLALAIAVAVAYGGKAFGFYDVTPGGVLYLDLESNQRRMQARLRAIISETAAWPENFHIATDWKRGDEGIAQLDAYCDARPETRLVVIDIWAKFRAPRDPKADPYEQDYGALQALNAWAERRRVTVLVIHHTRKAKADDVFEEISGTTGIIGAVATAMVLTRSPDIIDEQILHLRGRDLIEDDPIALKWDGYTCQHIYVATGKEASSSAQRRHILEVMEETEEYPVKEIARLVNKSIKAVDNQLRRLIDDELVVRTGRGMYAKIIKSSGNDGDSGSSGSDGKSGKSKVNLTLSTSDQGVEKGVESGLGLSKDVNGSFHTFHGDSYIHTDCSIDCVDRAGVEVWRLWHDPTESIIGEYATEAEAQAAAHRGTHHGNSSS